MARGSDIDQFPTKLKRAMDRVNLSRAQLAQAVGADKSVIARWLSGAINPADHSLSLVGVLLAGRRVCGAAGRGDKAWTCNGTAVHLHDDTGIQTADRVAGQAFEAGWRPDGAGMGA